MPLAFHLQCELVRDPEPQWHGIAETLPLWFIVEQHVLPDEAVDTIKGSIGERRTDVPSRRCAPHDPGHGPGVSWSNRQRRAEAAIDYRRPERTPPLRCLLLERHRKRAIAVDDVDGIRSDVPEPERDVRSPAALFPDQKVRRRIRLDGSSAVRIQCGLILWCRFSGLRA